MSEDKDKRYCVVDHANKQRERRASNPNRLKLTRERYGRWIETKSGSNRVSDDDGGD